ncbi:HIT family protein [Streptomyces sp. NPDC058665]|uniref:HIT family protein n=1 Tax=Streptomyces sp. NPDC058665 TaxID=3346586 RepID=UPI00364A70AC
MLEWAEVQTQPAGSATLGAMTREDRQVADCFVCDKHRDATLMPGGSVHEDDLVVVSHLSPRAPGQSGTIYLGHLLVEPRRHAAGLADLTDEEAGRIGRRSSAAARTLREVAGAEHVYAAVIGDQVSHLHLHLLPRYPGTPRQYWWTRVDEWPQAPRGGEADAAELVERLRAGMRGSRLGGG